MYIYAGDKTVYNIMESDNKPIARRSYEDQDEKKIILGVNIIGRM